MVLIVIMLWLDAVVEYNYILWKINDVVHLNLCYNLNTYNVDFMNNNRKMIKFHALLCLLHLLNVSYSQYYFSFVMNIAEN